MHDFKGDRFSFVSNSTKVICTNDYFSDFYRRVKSSRVTVIGIFGKTSLSESRLEKGLLFDDFIQRDVFRIADSEKADGDSDSKVEIGLNSKYANSFVSDTWQLAAVSEELQYLTYY